MSYDYNALVSRIVSSRRLAEEKETDDERLPHIQEAVDAFSTLSTCCPMTPLLWMQYSYDTGMLLQCLAQDESSVKETRIQMLELALAEFPGSAILHVHFLQLLATKLPTTSNEPTGHHEKLEKAITDALRNVGMGSHRNEGVLVAKIYQMAAEFFVQNDTDRSLSTFIQRARTPMKDVNQGLTVDVQEFCSNHDIAAEKVQQTLGQLDEARRFEARTFYTLVSCEDDVDVAMHDERILARHQMNLEELPWRKILLSDGKTYWMGYGGVLSANAFIQYAQKCFRYKKKSPFGDTEGDQDHEDETHAQSLINGLSLCVYERGIAECPTVESLWISYIRHLTFRVQSDTSLLSRLNNVVDRAVRNCPYSFPLYQQKLQVQGLLAQHGVSVLDPDALQKTVKEALDAKFLTSREAILELYMSAIQVVRRHVLFLLAKAAVGEPDASSQIPFDEPEPFKTNMKAAAAVLDTEISQEVEDLCDDYRELYDTIDAFLRKKHSSWSDGRGRLWSERAFVESYLLSPLTTALGDKPMGELGQSSTKRFVEALQCHDKLTKIHQPTHPDTYRNYITFFGSNFPTSGPSSVISKIRRSRYLFQKALKSVGKPKQPLPPLDPILERDYETGLQNLCHEYLVFERYFGSDKSLAAATKAVEKKLARIVPSDNTQGRVDSSTTAQADSSTTLDVTSMKVKSADSIKLAEEDVSSKHNAKEDIAPAEPPMKKMRCEDNSTRNTEGDPKAVTKESNYEKPVLPKVKVGNLEYPAHPFTVRVSNLVAETEDMDLVEIFRSKCGAIVHAKIIREKPHHYHGKGKSKGWGLIQFEIQESVERALELSEVVGIREKLVKVDRSHMPAVGLVPPGMNKVNPKGEGRSSKRNQKRKEQKVRHDAVSSTRKPGTQSASAAEHSKGKDSSSGKNSGILAFRPRGVQQSQRKRKLQLSAPSPKGEIGN